MIQKTTALKAFDSINYPDGFPVAQDIESLVNTTSGPKRHLETIVAKYGESFLDHLAFACLLYWSEAQHWDDRNRVAVLSAKKIVEQYPQLKYYPEKGNYGEDILKNAYAFTRYAHRYLQAELFAVILERLKQTDALGIYYWYMKQEFVLTEDHNDLIPYEEWKIRRLTYA